MLILSPFAEKEKRISSERALERNRFIAAFSDAIFIPYAAPASKTDQLCNELLAWNKPLYTFPGLSNNHLIDKGIKTIDGHTIEKILHDIPQS